MTEPIDKSPQSPEEVNLFTLTGTLKNLASYNCSHVIFSGKESEHCDKKEAERGACCNSCAARRSAVNWLPRVEALLRAFHMAQALKDASRSLVSKMDMMHEDPRYKGVWTIAQVHNGQYSGPQYEQELIVLRGVSERLTKLIDALDIGVIS